MVFRKVNLTATQLQEKSHFSEHCCQLHYDQIEEKF